MANSNGGASRNGVLVPVSDSSDIFHNSILGPLQNAYLYEESKQSFKYKSAFLIKNATLQEKYETFRVQRRDAGYSEEDLKESYGFLLFDDKNKANTLGETGVVAGNGICTTLGDPLKGVYVSKYSDCLDINRWYHGKTGYIAIIKLTKGRVKNVSENYTQNFTAPSEGFDCHVSEQLAAVSAYTSSFLAFERTQYYMYELLDGGHNKAAQSPCHACPFAIVSFTYGDTKATPSEPQEKSEEKKAVLHYFPWRGQLQISSQLFNVGLKSTTGALMPAKLPAVVKVDRAISMVDLRQLVPKAAFETCFSGEVSLDGMCCNLYELVPSEVADTSLALLTQELMTKDLALTVQLNDGGFLILLHSSHFLTYDDARSNTTEVLQGMFVFPDSRAIQRDTKVGQKKPTISSEILQVLPALNYAESEVEKCYTDQTGELCGLLEQHIQSYADLISPGLAGSPSREASIFPDQYDVPDALKYLYSAPKLSSRAWQCFKSYQSQPGSFQLPVSRATELLKAAQEERSDDPDDEVYVFLSSPEEAPATSATMCLEAHLEAQESPTHADTLEDSHMPSVGAQDETTIVPQNEVADILQSGGSPIDMGLSKTDGINEMKNVSISPTSSDLTTELIVSITSAEGTTTVLNRSLVIKSAVPVTKHCEVHLSNLSPAKLQMPGANSLSEKGDKANKPIECAEISNTPTIYWRKLPRGRRKGRKISSKSSVQTSSLPEAKSPVDAESSLSENHEKASQPSVHPEINYSSLSENHDKASQPPDHQEMNDSSLSENHDKASQPPDHQEMNDSSLSENHDKASQPTDHQEINNSYMSEKASQSSNHQELNDPPKIDWRKLPRRRRKGGKLSSKYKRILRSAGVKVKEKEPEIIESIILMEPEILPLRKKTERWDLKPVITECGRIFVPHGSSDIIKCIELLKGRHKATGWEHCPDKIMLEASVEALQPMEIGQDLGPALEMKRGQKVTTDTMDGGGHCQNIDGSEVNSGRRKQSNDGDGSQTRKPDTKEISPEINMTQADATDPHAPEPFQKKHNDGPIPVEGTKKSAFSLSKLKTVLLKGKRKTLKAVSSDATSPGHAQGTEHCVQGTEPSLKRSKADVTMDTLETYLIKGDQDTTVDTETISKTPTLDPLFAQALCLTPKDLPDKIQKTQSRDIQLRRDSSNVQDQVTPQVLSDKLAQPLQSPLSQISGRSRMKTLKKRENISRESLKKKWWLHFHTPAFSCEKPKSKVCTRNSSVRKNLKEKLRATCPSTDALTLLADLALSASNGQVPQQPDPALERKLDSSLETCVEGPESASVLHALLRQPTARPILPPKSPSPKGLVGSKDVVVLITKEHAYSLPPSSSLLLGLSGAPFQVSPLSGSAGLMHLRHNMNSDGARALHAVLCQEGKSQDNLRASESLSKDMVRRRKFRHSRTFVEKDGSIQVTRLWKENYDFSLDSKFTNDPKDKTVTRALHGSWDFSIQDTNEQVQLIVHMWIGLFYSRSTARFFHFDSTLPCLEDNDCLEMSDRTVPAQTTPDPKTSSSALVPTKTPESKAIDLSKKDTPVLNQESVLLDLSLRKHGKLDLTSDTQVNIKELPVSDEHTETIKSSQELEPSLGLCESSTSYLLPAKNQPFEICREKADLIDKIGKLDDDRSSIESRNTSNPQKTSNLEHSDAVSFKKSDGTSSVLCEEMENECIPQENVLGIQKTEMRDCNENLRTAEGEVVRQVGIDSSKIIVHEEMDSNCDFANLIHPIEGDENDINDGDHIKPIDKPHRKENVESSPPAMLVNDDTTNDETAAVGGVILLKNDTRPAMQAGEESESLSLGQDEKIHEEKDHHPVDDRRVLGDEPQIRKRDGADLKDRSPTVVHPGSDLSDKALPMLYDDHGSREDKLIAECTGNVSLAEKPPQVDKEKEACNTSLLEVQCANEKGSSDEKTMPAQDYNNAVETLPMERGDYVSVDEATSEMIYDIHSRDEVLPKKAAYPVCDENTPTLDESTRDIPQTLDDIVGERQNKVKSDLSVVSSSDSEDKDTRLIEWERKLDNHASEITSMTKQWQPSQGKTSETLKGQIGIPLIREDFGQDIASTQISLPKDEISESMHNRVDIPLIGIEAPWQETLHTQVSQDDTQEVVQGQKEMPLIRQTNGSVCIKQTELDNTSQENGEKAPLFAGKFIGFVHSDSNQKMASKEGKSDNRCPTPAVDEKLYDDIPCPDHFSSISASGDNNGVCKIFTGSDLSRSSTPTQDELPLDQELNDSCSLKNVLLPEPRVNIRRNLHCDLTLGKEQVFPDHELRTIRNLSPTEKQLCESNHMNDSSQLETTEMNIDQEQAPNPSNKPISSTSPPSHWSTSYFKGDKVDECVASTSTKHQLHIKSVHNTLNSSSKCALEETGQPTTEQYLSRIDGLKDISSEQDSSLSSDSIFNTAEFVQAVINQARGRATMQDNVPHEIRSHSQRPVMAVRPSKSDESRADYISKEGQGYSSTTSDVPSDKPTKVALHTHTTLSATILSRQTDESSGLSEDLNENEQENIESCSKTNWLSDDQDIVHRFNLDKVKLDLIDGLYQYQETNEQKFAKISNFSKIGQTAEDWIEINEDPQVEMSAVVLDYKEKGKTNDIVGPSTSSLKRTVFNSTSEGSKSLVDQLSERCSESDLTQSSMEQESLIFSERMNQLMKRNRRGTSYSKNKYGRSKPCRSETASCPSPVTVRFSSLGEQEDSVDHWEALPSLVGQKIRVDMPERRGLAETTGGEKTLHLHKLSFGKGNPLAHAMVSDMTTGCARSYNAMMDDVCAGKKLPSKTEISFSKVEASNHVDSCGQMKKEMYDSLHSNLNSVVRQSCKTKFRFYILVTSADAFFEETKELLKGEGHTEVQPSQFFLGEESSSPLLIILRNEDIAEHICEVPHLLELKKSPGVLFAGIDQPDDIVSLTHQELFSRGGFVVFEGTALETLSLCNMKIFSQFLEEQSKKGKWKWLLHYRDSRHLKENARLTAEAMEKKQFIDCCQEAGMVEVLPYHECDIMSRDQPNYLNCLVRLQVQNISARFPVFITDTTADSSFGKNGVLTMNINSFLLISQSDTCSIS